MMTDARPLLPQIRAKTRVLYAFDPTMGRSARDDRFRVLGAIGNTPKSNCRRSLRLRLAL
jgi:hypothetical protein